MTTQRKGLCTYFTLKDDVDLGDATGGHRRRGVKPAKLFHKCFRKRTVDFEVIELIRVLQKSDDSLDVTRQHFIRDNAYLVYFWRDQGSRD
jgi:hypothetical protein